MQEEQHTEKNRCDSLLDAGRNLISILKGVINADATILKNIQGIKIATMPYGVFNDENDVCAIRTKNAVEK